VQTNFCKAIKTSHSLHRFSLESCTQSAERPMTMSLAGKALLASELAAAAIMIRRLLTGSSG